MLDSPPELCIATQAGHQLVVLEVESSETCDSGIGEEADLHWREDRAAALARCAGVKHVFQRTARDSPDVTFLTLEARPRAACGSCGAAANPALSEASHQDAWNLRSGSAGLAYH